APSATPIAATENSSRATPSTGQIFTPYIVPDVPPSTTRETTASTGRGGEQPGNEPISGRATPGARDTRQTNRGSSPPAAYSIYVVAPEGKSKASAPIGPTLVRTPLAEGRGLASNVGVTVPSFGAMLPVRTLGAVYTLRQGSLARFELTRDMTGE